MRIDVEKMTNFHRIDLMRLRLKNQRYDTKYIIENCRVGITQVKPNGNFEAYIGINGKNKDLKWFLLKTFYLSEVKYLIENGLIILA